MCCLLINGSPQFLHGLGKLFTGIFNSLDIGTIESIFDIRYLTFDLAFQIGLYLIGIIAQHFLCLVCHIIGHIAGLHLFLTPGVIRGMLLGFLLHLFNLLLGESARSCDGNFLFLPGALIMGLDTQDYTDDIREAPALTVMERLLDMGAVLQVYDPVAMDEVKNFFLDYPYPERIIYTSSPEEALVGAEALIINTEWDIFRRFDLSRIKALMANPLVFDGRNIFDPDKMKEQNIPYYYIGKPFDKKLNQVMNGISPSLLEVLPSRAVKK